MLAAFTCLQRLQGESHALQGPGRLYGAPPFRAFTFNKDWKHEKWASDI
eukprot:CAMPEP_0114567848 /NCGR_PEP_ID=MMETSP0114-20121206/15723_1 /TAXON_ID=31324 /ORGANISM="Goniomonas sp, Strain m" /LENGTH=48 /DNA_ID= /DNA_START= /DNA_END= /DNA_ORIENTATION=